MPRYLRALLVAAAVAAASLLWVGPAAAAVLPSVGAEPVSAVGPVSADVDDFSFSSLDVDYTLGREDDGTSTLKVVETFVADFPQTDQNHGMKRAIPDTYNGQPLNLHLVSVTDENGDPRPADTDDDDGWFTITSRSDQYLHGPQTFVFTYTARHVTWHFSDTGADEFYWDVNGTDWGQPFGTVDATLHVPADLAGALTGRQSCYQGAYGINDTCEITSMPGDGGAVTVHAQARELDARENMTIAVGFTAGTFTPFDPSLLASPWGWVQGVGVLAALASVVSAILVRVRRLRDAPGRPTIIAEYTPPKNVDALLAAVLRGATSKAVPAEVLEQAIRGSIRMIEGERRVFGTHKMQAELVDASRSGDKDGRMLLAGMFGDQPMPGDVFTFGKSNSRFAKAGQKMLKWGAAEVKRRRWKRVDTRYARRLPVLLAFIGLLVSVGAGVIAMAMYVSAAASGILLMAGVAAFVASMILIARSPLTADGAEVRDHLEGLKMFIEWAEADRIRMLQSPSGAEKTPVDVNDKRQVLKIYEALLPYAVVFGQEKEWAQQLATMYPAGEGPYWYSGNMAAFNAATFAAGISSLSATAASSSSTSGGSGGGGFSGGGGGGGGGGGV
ncbi:DUF2207 domain-containing protein [Microbacterium horticulturae]|uniref:DUF2207 domain-containing protein n=1 Tax=Microbacterium horticulturae TaxID=3028316 RepID=A0ABY8C0B9_9MICO|nr:DUF2207 domain-containing protein [Microbacterium sp. KACC 23027]WEG09567.1 DUF2207 domain-containing protein [Microbacterium sp. KACC 23027]